VANHIKKIYFRFLFWLDGILPKHNIPVLLYHSISDDNSKMSVSPEKFEQQLIQLKKAGYKSISLAELKSCFDKNIFPTKRVMITFDDGFLDNYEIARPLLKQYGFGAVFFIAGKYIDSTADFCTNDIDRVKKMMSEDQLGDLSGNNLEVANHFFSHKILSDMDSDEIKNEYYTNRDKLLKIVGDIETLKYVAYPKNKKNNVASLLEKCGVLLAFGGRPGVVKQNSLRYDLPRIQVYNNDSINKFLAKLSPYYYFLPWIAFVIKQAIRSPWFYLLLVLALSRFAFFWLGLFGFPANASLVGDWWTLYGGDEINYFKSAKEIIDGDVISRARPIGFPLFLIPFIWFSYSVNFIDAFPLVSFVNGVVLYSVALVLIYFLAKEILGSKLKAYIVAVIFNIYPYLFYFLFKIFVRGNNIISPFVESRFRQLMFWHFGSDPLSIVLILASLLCFILIIRNKVNSIFIASIVGLMSSWSVIARLQNLIILPIFFLAFLLFRKIKLLKYFFIFSLLPLFLQLYFNFISQDSIFSTSYKLNGGSGSDIPIFSFSYIFRIVTYPLDYGAILLAPIIIILVLAVVGFYYLIKLNKKVGLFLFGYVILNLLFILFLEPTFRNPRYFLPVIPILIIVLYLPMDQLINKIILYVKSK